MDGGVLVGQGGVDFSFNVQPHRLEDAFGGIEFGAVRRLLNEGDALALDRRRLMGRCPIPDDGLDAGLAPERHGARQAGGRRVERPGPPQPPRPWVDDEHEIAPPPLVLQRLGHLHPDRCPDPPRLADQPQPHLVRPARRLFHRDACVGQRRGQAPFSQASCSAGSTFGVTGRGTLGWTRSRAKSAYIPPSVYVTPNVSATHWRTSAAVRNAPVADCATTAACCSVLSQATLPGPWRRCAITAARPPARYQPTQRWRLRSCTPSTAATSRIRRPLRSSHSACSRGRTSRRLSAWYNPFKRGASSSAAQGITNGRPPPAIARPPLRRGGPVYDTSMRGWYQSELRAPRWAAGLRPFCGEEDATVSGVASGADRAVAEVVVAAVVGHVALAVELLLQLRDGKPVLEYVRGAQRLLVDRCAGPAIARRSRNRRLRRGAGRRHQHGERARDERQNQDA